MALEYTNYLSNNKLRSTRLRDDYISPQRSAIVILALGFFTTLTIFITT
jgi:hypothetical protein